MNNNIHNRNGPGVSKVHDNFAHTCGDHYYLRTKPCIIAMYRALAADFVMPKGSTRDTAVELVERKTADRVKGTVLYYYRKMGS